MVCGNDVMVCGNDVMVCGNDVMVCGNDVMVCGNDVMVCGNDVMVCGNDVMVCGNDGWRGYDLEVARCGKGNGDPNIGLPPRHWRILWICVMPPTVGGDFDPGGFVRWCCEVGTSCDESLRSRRAARANLGSGWPEDDAENRGRRGSTPGQLHTTER